MCVRQFRFGVGYWLAFMNSYTIYSAVVHSKLEKAGERFETILAAETPSNQVAGLTNPKRKSLLTEQGMKTFFFPWFLLGSARIKLRSCSTWIRSGSILAGAPESKKILTMSSNYNNRSLRILAHYCRILYVQALSNFLERIVHFSLKYLARRSSHPSSLSKLSSSAPPSAW